MLLQNQLVKAVIEFWKFVRNNAETLLACLILLFLPTQLGRHFWPWFAFVRGARIDYLSPTLYFTDVLILGLFLSWGSRESKDSWQRVANKKIHPLLLLTLLLLLFSIFFAHIQILGILSLLKLFELLFFGWYMGRFVLKNKQLTILMLSLGIIFESSLVIAQWFHQGSLNGIFYFFGERMYSGTTPGVANASIGGQLVLRPYGTFPHPNVLAGYLVIVMTLVLAISYRLSAVRKTMVIGCLILGSIALGLTLSRVAIVLWGSVLLFLFIRKLKPLVMKKQLFIFSFVVGGFLLFIACLMIPFVFQRFALSSADESVVQRLALAGNAVAMMKEHSLVGVGLNNFLVMLPEYQSKASTVLTIQPVHNIFLLIGAENGLALVLLSLTFAVYVLRKLIKDFQQEKGKGRAFVLFLILAWIEILILGMFDHYFLTIQQGQLLLALAVGIIIAINKALN